MPTKQPIKELKSSVPVEIIQNKIYLIRGQKVMFDRDLAELYDVLTKNLNKAVQRNLDRFPDDFMFQLTKEEAGRSRFQSGTLNRGQNIKYLPYVFTEQGVAMLSSVLNSEKAIQVNIQIIRTFTKLRELMATNIKLRKKIESMENKYDNKFRQIFDVLKQLLMQDVKPKKQIGFKVK